MSLRAAAPGNPLGSEKKNPKGSLEQDGCFFRTGLGEKNHPSTSRWRDFHALERNEWKYKELGAAGKRFLAGHCVATDVAKEPEWGFFFFKAFTR